ncbi:hypothetical protein T07_4472 [Trichinella nelsoni]|uniref:Uncharacterized protein n=1 Tax=Trichinella nelsoni TaxID=6336 RepID=A0A0V0S5B4_9BILA|nr:hypothetical protein T07_4472 [Trichinella nelsoni]
MKLAHISIAFNQLAGTGNSIAISCYKLYEMQKKLKVYLLGCFWLFVGNSFLFDLLVWCSTVWRVFSRPDKKETEDPVTSCTHISMSDVFNFHLAILGGLWRQFVRARPNQGRLQQLLSTCLCIFNSYIGACLDGLSGSREQLFPAHGAARLRCH